MKNGKKYSLIISNRQTVNILQAAICCQNHCATYYNKKCFLRGTNHRHPAKTALLITCYQYPRGQGDSDEENVAAPRSGVYWRRRPEPAQARHEGSGLPAPVRHRGAWISEEVEQDRIPSKTCVFLTSGGSEIESSQDICRSYSDRPSHSGLE